MRKRKTIFYRVVTDFIGDPKNGLANGYDIQTFSNKKDAKKHWEKEYRDRKKRDGHDAYWNKKPFYCMKETIITEFV